MDKVIVSGDARIVVRRRTVLIEARRKTLIRALAEFYQDMAKALGVDAGVVDELLSRYADVSAHAVESQGLDWELLAPTDTLDELRVKCEHFFEVADAGFVEACSDAIEALNRSWNNGTGEKKILPTTTSD